MLGQRFQYWLVMGAACLLLVMLVCPYLPTPTGIANGPSIKILIQAMCLIVGAALLVVSTTLERAVAFVEWHRPVPAPDLTDLTCIRLC